MVDVTQNYGAAFYSCAVGMGLGAICLAMVGPTKSGMCQRRNRKSKEEENISQDNDQPDFLEVDFVPENSPAKQAVDQDKASVI